MEEPEASSDPRLAGSPDTLPSPPLFSLTLLHTLPCTTPLDDSRHSSHSLPLHLSLVPSTLFLALRRSLCFAPCLDFVCTAKWGYFALMCHKHARNGKTIVNLLPKLIYISPFNLIYSKKMHNLLAVIILKNKVGSINIF